MVLGLLLIQSFLLNQRKRRLHNKVKVFLALHALRAQNLCGDHVLGNTLELREWFVLLIFKALYELWYARFFLMIFPKAICINYFYAANVVTVSFPPSYQMVCSDKSQFSCEENTSYIQQKHGRKTVYSRHRRFLTPNHPYRRLRKAFNGSQEHDIVPISS